jgi:glutathione synthase/RimK-type ligase-like ATP-grasp enzyme
MRVLLSDGSGLTARQAATQLGAAGHEVHVLSPDPLCLARFTRHVRRVHRVPAYGLDPFGWLEAALGVLRGGFDVLLPTQEQVAVLSLEADRVHDLGVRMAVPPFAALRRVQDKLSAYATLTEVGLPQPRAVVASSAAELVAAQALPVFVKTPIGTATSGVRHVTDREGLDRAARELDFPVLVQEPVAGPVVMVQSIFDHGRLIAIHANLRTRTGASGGASAKRSIAADLVEEAVARLGGALDWHGALSLDAVLSDEGPVWIDVNPRLVEPGNAWRAGVDLVEALIARREQPRARAGVETRQLMIALLGAAQQRGARRAVLAELVRGRRGAEELTPVRGDPLAAVPLAAVTGALLVHPGLWRHFAGGAVDNYALTPGAWEAIVARAR